MKMRMELLLSVMMKKILVSENDVFTPEGKSMPESESISVDPELKADLNCLSRIDLLLTQRRKVALPTFFHF